MRYLAFIFTFLLVGCSVDELPPCDGVGIEGEVCKEYQYVFGRYNGVNDYEYDLATGLVSKVITKRKNGSVEGTTQYEYNLNDLVTCIKLEGSKGNVLSTKTFQYDEFNAVTLEKVEGQTNSELAISYLTGKINAEVYKVDGVVRWVDSLEYYSGTEELYRKLRYVDNVLSDIVYYEEFNNDIREERTANANGIIQSKKITRVDDRGNVLEVLNYSGGNSLTSRIVYTYMDYILEKVEKYDETGTEYEEINYQRF